LIDCILFSLLFGEKSNNRKRRQTHQSFFTLTSLHRFLLFLVLATALATSFVEYMNKRSAIEFYHSEKKRETWEYDNFVEGERAEMVELYVEKGMAQNDAEQVVTLLSKYKDLFIDVMMAEELQLISPDHVSPLETAFSTFLSYSFMGSLPILPLIVSFTWPGSIQEVTAFRLGVILTATALLFFGYLKSFFTSITWWQIMIANVFNGLFGIGSAYLLRWVVSTFLPSLAFPPFFHHSSSVG